MSRPGVILACGVFSAVAAAARQSPSPFDKSRPRHRRAASANSLAKRSNSSITP